VSEYHKGWPPFGRRTLAALSKWAAGNRQTSGEARGEGARLRDGSVNLKNNNLPVVLPANMGLLGKSRELQSRTSNLQQNHREACRTKEENAFLLPVGVVKWYLKYYQFARLLSFWVSAGLQVQAPCWGWSFL